MRIFFANKSTISLNELSIEIERLKLHLFFYEKDKEFVCNRYGPRRRLPLKDFSRLIKRQTTIKELRKKIDTLSQFYEQQSLAVIDSTTHRMILDFALNEDARLLREGSSADSKTVRKKLRRKNTPANEIYRSEVLDIIELLLP